MSQPLTVEYLSNTVPKHHKKHITDELVADLNHLVSEPDYGEEFKDAFITFTGILEGTVPCSLQQYVNAVKYYSLTAGGLSFTDAYIKVFPARLQARLDRGQTKADMGGEASRYNSSDTVNAIRKQALIPIHLVNQGTVQLAINSLTDIMLNGRSEVAKVTAASTLIKELRPPETQQVELQLGLSDEARSAQKKQSDQLIEIAENQRRLLAAGASIDDIQQLHIKTIDVEIDDE